MKPRDELALILMKEHGFDLGRAQIVIDESIGLLRRQEKKGFPAAMADFYAAWLEEDEDEDLAISDWVEKEEKADAERRKIN